MYCEEELVLGEDQVRQQPTRNQTAEPFYHMHKVTPSVFGKILAQYNTKKNVSHCPRHAAFSS
jgi:hypothetical protein